jgi:hypothetical protein
MNKLTMECSLISKRANVFLNAYLLAIMGDAAETEG